MHILLTGGTGFIGKALCSQLLARGDQLTVISRQPNKVASLLGSQVRGIASPRELAKNETVDAVINLSGQPIADARWNASRKASLLQSRLEPTQAVIEWIQNAEHKPQVMISASAVGYYGDMGGQTIDESSGFQDEFAHQLCDQWEQAARQAEALGVRVVIVRLGPVLGAGGGFLKKMLPAFKFGMGGKLGSGGQWFPWVHQRDVISAMLFLLDRPEAKGVFNLTAPQPVSNRVFTETLAALLKRPAFMHMPAGVLRCLFGEMADLLLGGQRAMPKRLLEQGFEFEFESLKPALQEVLNQNG